MALHEDNVTSVPQKETRKTFKPSKHKITFEQKDVKTTTSAFSWKFSEQG